MKENITVKKFPKSEIEISFIIPWEEIKDTFDEVIKKFGKEIQIKGFRKGKAPKKFVEEGLDKSKIYSQVVQEIIPKYYQKAIELNNLKPIISPKITLTSAEEGKDWEVRIQICEKPKVNLVNFKEELSKFNKGAHIWVPGENQTKTEDEEKRKEEKIQAIIKWLLENIKIEISDLMLEEEVNRRLSNLIDQTQKLGLTVEQYLKSTGKTPESIKEEYRKQANDLWRLELILEEISDKENIVVNQKDIEDLIQKASSDEEKKNLQSQRYLLASILRRQKTLDFLINL